MARNGRAASPGPHAHLLSMQTEEWQIRPAEPEGPATSAEGTAAARASVFTASRLSRESHSTLWGAHTFLNVHVSGHRGVPSRVGERRALGRATASTVTKPVLTKLRRTAHVGEREPLGGREEQENHRQKADTDLQNQLGRPLQCIPAWTSQAKRLRELAETGETRRTERWESRPGQ